MGHWQDFADDAGACAWLKILRRSPHRGRFHPNPDISPLRSAALRSRLVFDRLRGFLRSAIHKVIPLTQKTPEPIKSLTDLTQQLMKHPG